MSIARESTQKDIKVVLDTNVIIAVLNQQPWMIAEAAKWGDVYVPCIAVGELYFGAMRSARSDENIRRVVEFTNTRVVLNCDQETARRYGEIEHRLKLRGRPIPSNDVWIAALAQQYDEPVATLDRHFLEIDGLQVVMAGQ